MKTRFLMLVLLGGLTVPGGARGQQIAEGYHYDAPSEARLDDRARAAPPLPGEHELSRGLGWILGTAEDGTPIAFVVGAAHGYTGLAVVDEVRKRGLVILTNGDGGLTLTEQVRGSSIRGRIRS